MELLRRWSLTSDEWQVAHEQAIAGIPCDDPVPRKVIVKIKDALWGSSLTYGMFYDCTDGLTSSDINMF